MFSTSLVAAATAAFNSSESVLAFFSSLYFCPVSLLCRSCRNGLFICRNSVFSALPPLRGLPCPFASFCLVCFQAVFLRFFFGSGHGLAMCLLCSAFDFLSPSRPLRADCLDVASFSASLRFWRFWTLCPLLPPLCRLFFIFHCAIFAFFFLPSAASGCSFCSSSVFSLRRNGCVPRRGRQRRAWKKRASGQAEGVCSAWFDASEKVG